MFVRTCFDSPESRKEAVCWVRTVSREVGLGFHPDTPASEYVNLNTDLPTFSTTEAKAFDEARDRAFDLLGEHIYQFGLTVQKRNLRRFANGQDHRRAT